MSPFTQNLNASDTRYYRVQFNGSLIMDDLSDLEQAISFAYHLHQITLSQKHLIEVIRKDYENMAMPLASFASFDYYHFLDKSFEPKE